MKNHLNLMSENARMRESVRSHIRLWVRIWMVSFLALGIAGFVIWWPAHKASSFRAQLEAEYEPIRLMKAENKSLQQKIESLNQQEDHILSLTDQFPTITLLGLLGEAVDATEKKVFLNEVDFELGDPNQATSEKQITSLLLEGFSLQRSAITKLTDSLQANLPFANIQLQSATDIRVNEQPMLAFTIECTF